MNKKVLIISSSPRKGGNSETLAAAFAKGAREAGNQVETVYLRRVADYRPERVQIVVELPLQVGRGFHFLFRPQVSGGLQQHDLLLVLQLLFRLVGIEQDHPGKHGVVLRPCLVNTDAQQ